MNAGARTFPIATSGCATLAAPVQVSRTLPSLARTRVIDPVLKLVAHTSAPSDLAHAAPLGRLVSPRTFAFWDVQKSLRAARRLPRLSTPSTVRDRNAAICRRETGADGS